MGAEMPAPGRPSRGKRPRDDSTDDPPVYFMLVNQWNGFRRLPGFQPTKRAFNAKDQAGTDARSIGGVLNEVGSDQRFIFPEMPSTNLGQWTTYFDQQFAQSQGTAKTIKEAIDKSSVRFARWVPIPYVWKQTTGGLCVIDDDGTFHDTRTFKDQKGWAFTYQAVGVDNSLSLTDQYVRLRPSAEGGNVIMWDSAKGKRQASSIASSPWLILAQLYRNATRLPGQRRYPYQANDPG